jgi:hypothetical protein
VAALRFRYQLDFTATEATPWFLGFMGLALGVADRVIATAQHKDIPWFEPLFPVAIFWLAGYLVYRAL